MQANQTGSRQSAEAQRSEMPGLSKSNVLDAMHLSKEAGVIRKVSNWIAKWWWNLKCASDLGT